MALDRFSARSGARQLQHSVSCWMLPINACAAELLSSHLTAHCELIGYSAEGHVMWSRSQRQVNCALGS